MKEVNYLQKNCIFEADTVFDENNLRRFLVEHTSIIRDKGYVRTQTGWKLMNYTLSDCTFENCSDCSQNEIVFISDKSEETFFEKLESDLRKSTY